MRFYLAALAIVLFAVTTLTTTVTTAVAAPKNEVPPVDSYILIESSKLDGTIDPDTVIKIRSVLKSYLAPTKHIYRDALVTSETNISTDRFVVAIQRPYVKSALQALALLGEIEATPVADVLFSSLPYQEKYEGRSVIDFVLKLDYAPRNARERAEIFQLFSRRGFEKKLEKLKPIEREKVAMALRSTLGSIIDAMDLVKQDTLDLLRFSIREANPHLSDLNLQTEAEKQYRASPDRMKAFEAVSRHLAAATLLARRIEGQTGPVELLIAGTGGDASYLSQFKKSLGDSSQLVSAHVRKRHVKAYFDVVTAGLREQITQWDRYLHENTRGPIQAQLSFDPPGTSYAFYESGPRFDSAKFMLFSGQFEWRKLAELTTSRELSIAILAKEKIKEIILEFEGPIADIVERKRKQNLDLKTEIYNLGAISSLIRTLAKDPFSASLSVVPPHLKDTWGSNSDLIEGLRASVRSDVMKAHLDVAIENIHQARGRACEALFTN